jgi:hypothetical protein
VGDPFRLISKMRAQRLRAQVEQEEPALHPEGRLLSQEAEPES